MAIFTDTLGFPLEWTCHICDKKRPDKFISVAVHDNSEILGVPTGTVKSNVRYCNDNPDCEEKAKSKTYPHHANIFNEIKKS